MTQSTSLGNIANVTRTQFRAEINTCFQSIASMNSGSTAPSITYAGMHWWDTQSSALKVRNGADNNWITIADFDGVTFTPRVDQIVVNEIATKKHVFNATAAPTLTDDSNSGYSTGSIVLATVSGSTNAYICLSATVGAAIWRKISPAVFAVSADGLVPGPTSTDITAGKVLSAAGTWVASGHGRSPMSVIIGSGSYAEISGFPTTSTEINLIFTGLSLAAAQEMYIQLGTTSGIETTGYSGLVRSDAGFYSGFTSNFQLTKGLAASEGYWGRVVLFNQGSNTWTVHSVLHAAGTSETHGVVATGWKTIASALTRVRVYAGASSSFDGGGIYSSYWA